MCFIWTRLVRREMNLDEDSGLSVSCGNGKLRQWLIEQIDSRRYPGLVWENDEKSIFRIPWKHAGKQDYNREEDAALFKVRPSLLSAHTSSTKHLTTAVIPLCIKYLQARKITFKYFLKKKVSLLLDLFWFQAKRKLHKTNHLLNYCHPPSFRRGHCLKENIRKV